MEKQRARTGSEKEYRKEQLKKAALTLFAQKGFKNTTVEMITKKAHLSPAAFYLYFNNKIAIYRALNKDGINILEDLMKQALHTSGGSSVDKLYALARAYYNFYREHTDYFYITEILHLGNDEFFYDSTMVKELEKRTLVLLQIVASVIEEGIEKNEFRKIDPMKTAVTLWGMIDGVLILEVKKSTLFTGFMIDALIEQLMDMVLLGVKKK
ncbi:MAG: TetR/AcrR family transcriptional regulator [Spirochaetes bacterium]|nr:TetR/AcrR family transcriptional regulator [Spirochaetota bacterium]